VSVVSSGTARESENGGSVSVENGRQELAAPLLHAAALTGEQTIIDVDRSVRHREVDASAAGPPGPAIMTFRRTCSVPISERREGDQLNGAADRLGRGRAPERYRELVASQRAAGRG
jgi:hypothetical protein